MNDDCSYNNSFYLLNLYKSYFILYNYILITTIKQTGTPNISFKHSLVINIEKIHIYNYIFPVLMNKSRFLCLKKSYYRINFLSIKKPLNHSIDFG